jgi:ubiquinone biosynthesis protein COQ4
MLACLGEITGDEALKKMLNLMENSDEGRQILADKPRINTKTVDFEKLKNLPTNTLGHVYWKFCEDNVSYFEVM